MGQGESHDQARFYDNTGGTDLAAADVALSAGWGSTAALTIRAGSDDTGQHFDIAVAGSGIAANPTITVTFKDGAFHDPAGSGVAQAPKVVTVSRGDANGQAGYFAVTSLSATQVVYTFVGTPVTANTYSIDADVHP